MKRLIMMALLLLSTIQQKASAQETPTEKSNILTQPLWGPVGYDHVEYYYIPDLNAYYYVPGAQYIYAEKKKHWVTVIAMPERFKNFDFYGAHKVVLNEPKPYMNYKANKETYAQYKGQHDQVAIRDSHEQKYMEKANHPEHGKWVSPQDIVDQQNREAEQVRVTAQAKQDSINRADQLAKEELHNKQDQQSKRELLNTEDLHNKQNQLNKQQLLKNESNRKR